MSQRKISSYFVTKIFERGVKRNEKSLQISKKNLQLNFYASCRHLITTEHCLEISRSKRKNEVKERIKKRIRKKLLKFINGKCPICSNKMQSCNLQLHLKLHELKTKQPKFECKVCFKKFYIKRALQTHLKSHEPQHQCNLCNKKIKNKRTFEDHLQLYEDPDAFFFCMNSKHKKLSN